MGKTCNEAMPDGVTYLTAPKVLDDRGCLCFAEGGTHVPFRIERVFWIFGVGEGQTRGEHAHRTCAEAIFPVHGRFDIEVDDGRCRKTFAMDRPERGILIPAGVWCCLKNFSPDAVCLVAASQPYLAEGYINDYDEFLKSRL